MCLLTVLIDRDQPKDRHVVAGEDGLILDLTDVDRLIARHGQLRAAEKSLQRIFDEVAQEVKNDRWKEVPRELSLTPEG
jgi:hypothetical protein